MTTLEAWKTAKALREKGLSNPKVAKELARMGYVSFKTGRALTPSAVTSMIRHLESGRRPADRRPSDGRDRSFLYRPRKRDNTATATKTEKKTKPAPMIGVEALKQINFTELAHSGAFRELSDVSSKLKTISIAIDTLLAAVK